MDFEVVGQSGKVLGALGSAITEIPEREIKTRQQIFVLSYKEAIVDGISEESV